MRTSCTVLTDGVRDAVQRERRRAFGFAELVRLAQRAAGTCSSSAMTDGRVPGRRLRRGRSAVLGGLRRRQRATVAAVERRRRTVQSSIIEAGRRPVVAGCGRRDGRRRRDAAAVAAAGDALFRSRHDCDLTRRRFARRCRAITLPRQQPTRPHRTDQPLYGICPDSTRPIAAIGVATARVSHQRRRRRRITATFAAACHVRSLVHKPSMSSAA